MWFNNNYNPVLSSLFIRPHLRAHGLAVTVVAPSCGPKCVMWCVVWPSLNRHFTRQPRENPQLLQEVGTRDSVHVEEFDLIGIKKNTLNVSQMERNVGWHLRNVLFEKRDQIWSSKLFTARPHNNVCGNELWLQLPIPSLLLYSCICLHCVYFLMCFGSMCVCMWIYVCLCPIAGQSYQGYGSKDELHQDLTTGRINKAQNNGIDGILRILMAYTTNVCMWVKIFTCVSFQGEWLV